MEAQKCNGNDQHVRPKTLVETLEHANPQFYPVVYVVLVTLLTYPVLTCTAERRFCADDEAENSSLKYHECTILFEQNLNANFTPQTELLLSSPSAVKNKHFSQVLFKSLRKQGIYTYVNFSDARLPCIRQALPRGFFFPWGCGICNLTCPSVGHLSLPGHLTTLWV